jgi:hypothetical protein
VPFKTDNVEKYGEAREATDRNIKRRMRFACWITTNKHIQTQRNMSYLLLSHGNSNFANAPECYVTRTVSLLCLSKPVYFQCRWLVVQDNDRQFRLQQTGDIFRPIRTVNSLSRSRQRNVIFQLELCSEQTLKLSTPSSQACY